MTTATLPREDFLSVRSFLRWAAMGVAPSAERAKSVLLAISPLRVTAPEVHKSVSNVAADVQRGILVSQDTCKLAEEQLNQVLEGALDSESDSSDVQRGG